MFQSTKEIFTGFVKKYPGISSVGAAILSETFIAGSVNTAITIFLSETMKESKELTALGLLAVASYNIVNTILDYPVLKEYGSKGSGSAKATLIYWLMKGVLPNKHNFNVAVAEFGTIALNLLGVSPDLSAMGATIASLISGDPSYFIMQRTSSSIFNSITQLPIVIVYNRKLKNKKDI
ncbi:hypothetical protein A2954_03910 [Candidatus Roizmanbacteria bacterium RIFCSPLOWO2_01_FULL_37_12]|uniref:Uncharacterized protein n=1 Tax=Candidatus Roizmanbacteria bacterium RIFCSPLOWO2_01_FULL_37_12 TaxID=1802056 RepID=A0A1F7IEQ1_9BACT|nr:MAG: hypothetical protein A3D76_02685 [Candidatus Roizmanbacteria bacterium RIFCSPHIGHO2_02_FULL_37_9b]OGK41830.1 MAG: hypothetical protein A2954_03910 [Candidatus Roizmanbacteria bacterium RIFCSPLOWO2_01_FULL_37_12]